MITSLLQRICLRPNYSLRLQLLVSFGSAAFVTVTVVVVLACTSAFTAGTSVQNESRRAMQDQVIRNMLSSSRFVAERFSRYTVNIEGTVQLITETVQDRIVNYPNAGWETDDYVPFRDQISGNNVYPIRGFPLPPEWNMSDRINASNVQEHLQERSKWLVDFNISVSMQASWSHRGLCDPSVTDPSDHLYYPNCTNANNNFTTGGVVTPTDTNGGLYQKAAELSLFLKPLYESQVEALIMAIIFVNQGAGASISLPALVRRGADPPYVSDGCDYMNELNPYTGRPWLPPEYVARCRPAGTLVPQRDFNSLERPWFKEFVQNPNDVGWHGPYRAADNGIPLFTIGRAVLDRVSQELIGVAMLSMSIVDLSGLLEKSKLHNVSELALVKLDGQIVADTLGTLSTNDDPLYLWDVNLATKESFEKLSDMIFDRGSTATLRRDYANARVYEQDTVLTAHPVPVSQDAYDLYYRPRFLIVHRLEDAIFESIDEVDGEISDDVTKSIITTVSIGVVGMLALLMIIWCVARTLTQPLLWIEHVAWGIVNHSDERVKSLNLNDEDHELQSTRSATVKCTPKTEINDLVTEFRSMIQSFSGDGAAAPADFVRHEILNEMTWQSEFKQLYSRVNPERESFRTTSANTNTTQRSDDDSPSSDEQNEPMLQHSATDSQQQPALIGRYALSPPVSAGKWGKADASSSIVPAPSKLNRGENVMLDRKVRSNLIDHSRTKAYQSSLFWWIFVLIILPLLFTTALICSIVSETLVARVPEWVESARNVSVHLEIEALVSIASSKAGLTSLFLFETTRDLHLLTRVASWLYFDGINRADSFTEVVETTEECKIYPDSPDMSCPYFASNLSVCACKWQDPQDPGICKNYSTDPRFLQRRMFMANSIGVDPDTGQFSAATLYPEFWNSANTTSWYHDPADMPGSEKGSNASGYATMYDRLRVASALAVVEFPIYNYKPSLGLPLDLLGSNLALDADGLYQGYPGCDASFASLSHWTSTAENRGADVNSELCPRGKVGYDPRCRPWYGKGKADYNARNDTVYITPPYRSALREWFVSATSPVANQASGEYIGQAVVHFWPSSVQRAVQQVPQPVSFLITAESDIFGGDTVVGPNKSEGWQSAYIGDLLFPHGEQDEEYRNIFEYEVFPQMQNGTANVVRFERFSGDVDKPEVLWLAFEPVYERNLIALDPSDPTRGTIASNKHVFTLAIGNVKQNITAPFDAMENEVNDDLDRLKWTYISLAVFATFLFTALSFLITLSITRPMIMLLRIVETINLGRIEDDVPPLEGGSAEVRQVYSSFAKLNKTVRVSNVAFFSGNLQWAFHFLNDALGLFRKINDRKAIAVASNNLGNACYAWLFNSAQKSQSGNVSDEAEKIATALQRYEEAVEMGRQDFEECAREDVKSDYAQQLADRHFNRGLFLLLISSSAEAPENANEQAFGDIQRARELDNDVRDFWLEHKLLLRNSDIYFERLIRRIHGLAEYYDGRGLEGIWDIKEIIDDADRLLFAAWNEPSAPLFDAVTRVGRLQQLEAAVIRVESRKGRVKDAARLAMRMFAEDEYLLESCFWSAADALLRVMNDDETRPFSDTTVSTIRSDIRKMLATCRGVSLGMGKCVVFGFEMTKRWEGDSLWEKVNSKVLALYDGCCQAGDYVGLVAYTLKGDLNLPLEQKLAEGVRQRSILDIAASTTGAKDSPAFPVAVQMLIDAPESSDHDSYIVVLADGYSWELEPHSTTRAQIEQLNRKRSTKIHIIILGFDIEDDDIIDQCKSMCTVTKSSFYAEVTSDTIDTVFEQVMSTLSGPLSGGALQGITMEKF